MVYGSLMHSFDVIFSYLRYATPDIRALALSRNNTKKKLFTSRQNYAYIPKRWVMTCRKLILRAPQLQVSILLDSPESAKQPIHYDGTFPVFRAFETESLLLSVNECLIALH